jgi:hypothetical protein
MKAQEGENNVNTAGQNLLPLDEIRITPLMSKVNGPDEQWAETTAAPQVVKNRDYTNNPDGDES